MRVCVCEHECETECVRVREYGCERECVREGKCV